MPKSTKKVVQTLSPHVYNGELRSAVGRGAGYAFIERYFPFANTTIRISSAYFNLKGFQIGQEHVKDQVVYKILVGRDDGVDVQETVLNEITEEMRQPGARLTEVVKDLVERMTDKRFYIGSADAISQPFHCKFYICDDNTGWHGSANYSKNGLLENAEQVSLFPNVEDIGKFTNWFDNVAGESEDLLEPLLKLLKMWLEMASPFEVYLKALQYILGFKPETDHPFAPVFFQQVLIQAAFRQLVMHGGAFIVAATGLGKTIMGAEIALQFHKYKGSDFIIVLAPPLVHKKWETQFLNRSLDPRIFSTSVPFNEPKDKPNHQISRLKNILQRASKKTLIIIDEAHYYRNQQTYEKTRDQVSRVYQLFEPAIQKGAKIVLLTATVYGTKVDNLNGLLRLLPHHRIKNELIDSTDRWQVKSVDEFGRLDVVSVLSISDVLAISKKLNHIEDGQPYVQYHGDKRVYLPKQLQLRRTAYELPMEAEIRAAFDKKLFSQRDTYHIPYLEEDTGSLKKAPVNFLYKVALNSWLSSPAALAEAIRHNLATPHSPRAQQVLFTDELTAEEDEENQIVTSSGAYKLPLYAILTTRKQLLEPILEALQKAETNDDKLNKLIEIVDERHTHLKGKVLVFIRRHITAIYLMQKLEAHYKGSVKVGSTIEEVKGKVKLKSRAKRDETLLQFSPSSFPDQTPSGVFDVLICTDADGLGVDLPEADTVVNYDIPEGADVLFQRAGRILRMTPTKNRYVVFYTFVPTAYNSVPIDGIPTSVCNRAIQGKFNRLIKRHHNASSVLKANVIGEQHKQDISLLDDGIVNDIEDFMKEADMAEGLSAFIKSSRLEHELVLLQNKEECKALPDFVHSARYHQQKVHFVFLIIQWQGQYWPVLYNADTRVLEHRDEQALLDLIACKPDTQKAFITVKFVEILFDMAIKAWCADDLKHRSIDDVTKWCAMLLLPQVSQEEATRNFAQLVDSEQHPKKKSYGNKKKPNNILTLFDDK